MLARAFGLSLVVAFACVGVVAEQAAVAQRRLAESVLRLHVLANSDSEADQALKLAVRDRVIDFVQGLGGADLANAKQNILDNLGEIERMASGVIYENGFDYEARASLGDCVFPTKTYGDIALPSGIYEALRVEIGEAKGANWWCVVYPNICFIGQDAELKDESKEKLQGSLGNDEYALITGKAPIKFRILEWLNR